MSLPPNVDKRANSAYWRNKQRDLRHKWNAATNDDGTIATGLVTSTSLSSDFTITPAQAPQLQTERTVYTMAGIALTGGATDPVASTTGRGTSEIKIITFYIDVQANDQEAIWKCDLMDGSTVGYKTTCRMLVNVTYDSYVTANTADDWEEAILSVDISALSGRQQFAIYIQSGHASFDAKMRRGELRITATT